MSSGEYTNGTSYNCRVSRKDMEQLNDTLNNTKIMLQYAKHLEKLDALVDIKDHLLAAATGKGYMDIKTANLVFKILGLVIVGLIAVILFLLTGSHAGIIGELHR